MSPVALHRNEMPHDIPMELKRRIADQISNVAFNIYPEPFAQSLVVDLALWYGCRPEQLMVAPGSSAFIRLLFTHYAIKPQGYIVIARPSFQYYEEYCQAFGIAYSTWELDEHLEFDENQLGKLPEQSMVMFASPNNPTGQSIPLPMLKRLLRRCPQTLFVVDEAYAEFAGNSALKLINNFSNLIVLRTLSKALSAAGIRCGALIANERTVSELTRLQTPFQVSSLTSQIVKQMLAYDRDVSWVKQQIQKVIKERQLIYETCQALLPPTWYLFQSEANFLLLKCPDHATAKRLVQTCNDHDIAIADLSNLPRLAGCVRITVGLREHNHQFISALTKCLDPTLPDVAFPRPSI